MEFLKKWHQTTFNHAMEIGGEAKKYVEAHNINIESTTEIFYEIGLITCNSS